MNLSLLSIFHKPVSLPVTPVKAKADILTWHLPPEHGNFPLTHKAGFTRAMYERSWDPPDKNTGVGQGVKYPFWFIY